MTVQRAIAASAGVALVIIALALVTFIGVTRRYGPSSRASAAPSPTAPATPGRKIKARLYYVSENGAHLTAIERDVAYGEGPAAQAQAIINAQIAPVTEPLVSAVPPGARLRALYVTERGDAYVDLSREVIAGHSGGSLDELLTVYTIVDVLTTNLPAITAVQVLVDGKEVETLAGHVDLRRPLSKNLAWVE